MIGASMLAGEGAVARARPIVPALSLRDQVDRGDFVALATEWNALVERSGDEPFCRHEYVKSFLDNFAPGAPLKVLTARDASGLLRAALPLVGARGSLCGIGVRQWESPSNIQSLRFDLVGDPGHEAAGSMFELIAQDTTWDVLRISDVPEGGKAWRIYEAAREAGFPVGAWESQRSPYITLPSSHRELMEGLSTKFKANLRRRRKRLAEKGQIRFERVSGKALSEALLEECFALERRSWKGRQGSATSQSQAAHGFHLDLLKTTDFRANLSLSLLRVDGKTVAFHYGITSHGVYSLVMTSYDELFREFSPGHLLTEEVLKDCVSRGLREFDFLGCDLPWKLEWTGRVRPHHWLFVFRNSLKGRALRELKFGWARAARLLLTRSVS